MELKYKKVVSYLMNIFKINGYIKGQQLPTEHEIMSELGVSRNTVRKAILEMEGRGIVERKHGSGTFYSGEDVVVNAGGLIGLVNLSEMDYIFPEIIKGVEDTLYNVGYSPVLAGSCLDIEKEISSLKMLFNQGVKGLIIDLSKYLTLDEQKPILDLVESFNIPVVLTHWFGTYKKFSSLYIDDEKIGYDAAMHFIKNGHKKIGIIYKANTQAGLFRLKGFKKAIEESGLEINENYISSYDDFDDSHDMAHAYECTLDLLEKTDGSVTGIFYWTDKCAMEGYKAIESRGLTIPDDISVIGFDNFKTSMFISPPLSTFEHPKYDMGRWAAKILLDEIDNSSVCQPKGMIFEPILIERGSVKKNPV